MAAARSTGFDFGKLTLARARALAGKIADFGVEWAFEKLLRNLGSGRCFTEGYDVFFCHLLELGLRPLWLRARMIPEVAPAPASAVLHPDGWDLAWHAWEGRSMSKDRRTRGRVDLMLAAAPCHTTQGPAPTTVRFHDRRTVFETI